MSQVRKKIAPPLVGSDIILVIRPGQNINQVLDCTYDQLVQSLQQYFSSADGFVPETRTLTINGVTYDLSQNRSWTVSGGGAVDSVNGQTGVVVLALDDLSDVNAPSPSINQILQWNGTAWVPATVTGTGTVTTVSAGTGMNFPAITISGSVDIDTTKVPYLSGGFSTGMLKWNGSAWVFDNTTYQPQLNGTGFVKASGTTITYDNSTYVPTSRQVATTNSLTGGGDLSANRTLQLVNDQASPGANKVYGTDGSGNRTWKADPSGGGGILHATASGTNTYTATIAGVTAYNDGDAYLIRFTNGNDVASPTLNINSIGAINLYRNNDGQLLGGDISNGGEMLCVYNSSLNVFQCIGTSPNSLFAYVTNVDTVAITKGMPVVAWGGTGDRMTVQRAYNTDDAYSAQTIGLVYSSSIGVNQKGFIMIQGLLDGLNIVPTPTWADGDPVYLGATAGTITKTKPYAPNHLVYLGFVTTANPGSAGRIYVKVQNGYELDELHNVQARTPSLKDTLWYDNTVSPAQWKTASIATILGYTPLSQTLANTNIFVGNASNIATAVAMSGDATLANTGALTIANNAVTYAKMQAVSTTSRLLGSSSTTTPVQEITLGTGLSLSGTTLSVTGGGGNSIGELTSDVTAGPASSPSQSVPATLNTSYKTGSCGVVFDGQGGVISNGRVAYVQVPYKGTITGWQLVSSVAGSCTITVRRDGFGSFPPTTSIVTPVLSGTLTSSATGLSISVAAGDWIGFTISGVTTVTWVNLTLSITKII